MRFLIKQLYVLLVIIALMRIVLAENHLHIYLVDVEGKPISAVRVSILGFQSTTSDVTGLALINHPPNTKPGDWVQLSISPASWILIVPWDGRLQIPLTKTRQGAATVVVVRKGDRKILRSQDAIRSLVSKVLEQVSRESEKRILSEEERTAFLLNVASEYGLSIGE